MWAKETSARFWYKLLHLNFFFYKNHRAIFYDNMNYVCASYFYVDGGEIDL